MLDQLDRITAIKRQLRIGQEITYFEGKENRLIPAFIEDIQRTRLLFKNKENDRQN